MVPGAAIVTNVAAGVMVFEGEGGGQQQGQGEGSCHECVPLADLLMGSLNFFFEPAHI